MPTLPLSSLLQRTTIEDHVEVLASANAVLAKSKSDLHALHVKVVALSKLDRYQDSLRVFDEAGDILKRKAALEYGYALYKCGREDESIDVATRYGSGRGSQHLEAQASYRAERFHRAADIYEELSKGGALATNEVNDLRINAWATDAQLQWKGYPEAVRHTTAERDDLEAFETAYNAACLSIAKGELEQADSLLKRAKELCCASEDLTPEDIAAELLPIAVQQLYVLTKRGKMEDVESVLDEITIESISEYSTKKIARNNVALARDTSNPYLLYKALHEMQDSIEHDMLFDFQKKSVVGNSFSVSLLVQKYSGVIRSTSKALSLSSYPSTDPNINLLSVYNAAAHVQGQAGMASLKHILPLLDRRPKDLGLLLTVIQLYTSGGNAAPAITILERSLQALEESISEQDLDVRFNPGLLGVLVSLYRLEGRNTQIRAELSKAATYWRKRGNPPVPLLRAAGVSLLRSSDRSDITLSGDIFKALHQNDVDDRFAVAGYVASQATTDYAKVEPLISSLPSVQDLTSGIDVAALESAGIAPPSSMAAATIAGTRKRSSGDKESCTTKRVRKSRLPKDYDPNKTPDPERWLPLRDRSTYRPKGRKAKQRAAERMQGGIVNEKQEDSVVAAGQKAQSSGVSAKKKKKGKR